MKYTLLMLIAFITYAGILVGAIVGFLRNRANGITGSDVALPFLLAAYAFGIVTVVFVRLHEMWKKQ